ncbi:MAG: DUF1223 domain-containing protein [Candidatus Thiodiazotropha sp. (ex Epidulcina cf. delphinae)]|nr:DUF1223 domain-containing protein [Candidatus Thiodiazotropha sp. (ex Epidulcina cf. delphinae)]
MRLRPVFRLLLAGLLMALVPGLQAEPLTLESPVERVNLLELYTSHGCSSCPPADAWLRGLEEHPGLWRRLIPIAFHVDYWDDLGWPDRFATATYTQRQRDYRRSGALQSVYTPGFVLNGREWRGWFRRHQPDLQSQAKVGRLTLRVESGQGVKVRFAPTSQLEGVALQANLALLGFGLSTPVGGGENRGHTLKEGFVVLSHNHADALGDDNGWRFDWPDIPATEASKLALVVWLNHPGSAEPVQAAGGWLP